MKFASRIGHTVYIKTERQPEIGIIVKEFLDYYSDCGITYVVRLFENTYSLTGTSTVTYQHYDFTGDSQLGSYLEDEWYHESLMQALQEPLSVSGTYEKMLDSRTKVVLNRFQ